MLWTLLGSCGRDSKKKNDKPLYQLKQEMEDAKKALSWARDGGPNSNCIRELMHDMVDTHYAYEDSLAESKTFEAKVPIFFSTLWVRFLMILPRK